MYFATVNIGMGNNWQNMRTRFKLHKGPGLPVMMGNLGFHLSSSISPSRDTLSRNRGRREVEDRSLWRHTDKQHTN